MEIVFTKDIEVYNRTKDERVLVKYACGDKEEVSNILMGELVLGDGSILETSSNEDFWKSVEDRPTPYVDFGSLQNKNVYCELWDRTILIGLFRNLGDSLFSIHGSAAYEYKTINSIREV